MKNMEMSENIDKKLTTSEKN